MKRIAFFVEGQTEQIFVNRLVREILETNHVNIIQKQFRGGASVPKQEIVINRSFSRKPRYEVLIFDCGSDNRVKSEILDNIVNLRNNGYNLIVGLRDLYPMSIDELDKLEKGLKFLPVKLREEAPYFDIVIAVHEIEAWFLAETNHYQKIDKRLTPKLIKKHLTFSPFTSDMEMRFHPAKDLDDIYHLVGKSYTKRYGQTQRIVTKLDFHNLLNNVAYTSNSLGKLVRIIRGFKNNE